MSKLQFPPRSLFGLLPLLALGLIARRLNSACREHKILPSLYQAHPDAARAIRKPQGLKTVPLDQIVGTARLPSQNTADFQPLPHLRGRNWQSRWQRIVGATHRLAILPPVDLLQYGDEFWVEDGHNRVAAARSVDGVAIDADVKELVRPGQASARHDNASLALSLVGAEDLRQAGRGRYTRTNERRSDVDGLSRQELLDRYPPANEAGAKGGGTNLRD